MRAPFVALCLSLVSSCSLLIDKKADQCASDRDCVRFPGTTCDQELRLCSTEVGLHDAGKRPKTVESDAGAPKDAPADVADPCSDPSGCFACTPTTDQQFANACSPARCHPFDNEARLKRRDASLLPLLTYTLASEVRDAGKEGTVPMPVVDAGTVDAGPNGPATVDCDALVNPIYVAGSSAAKPFLAEIAKILAVQVPPVSVVYAGQGSCTGVAAIVLGTPVPGPFAYWDGMGTEQSCTTPGGVVVDLGISDVFATTCMRLSGGLPSNVGDFLGPVQTMTFVTPKASTQETISAEAAYLAFGFGGDSGAAPWENEALLFQRDDQSGTQRMVGAAIGLDPARFRGTRTSSSGDLKTKVSTAMPPEAGLGILATDVAQENRALLKILAYQHAGQRCGYYPDRDESSNEKQNVRDGHYAIWGPLHFLTLLGNSGYARKPTVGDIIGFMTGTKAPPLSLDLIALEAQRHVVPQCAMRVKRTEEIGPLASFVSPQPCGCYYEKVANGSTACAPCRAKSDCPMSATACSYGYCEGP